MKPDVWLMRHAPTGTRGTMRKILIIAALSAAAGVSSAASAASQVRVAPQPEAPSWSWRSASERDAACQELARFLKRLADERLPADDDLEVELLEVRPAGRFEPWRPGFDDVRIVTDVTPPRIRLSYRLKTRGRTVAGGEETLTDPNYLSDLSARASIEPWPYEKALLRGWLDRRVAALRPTR